MTEQHLLRLLLPNGTRVFPRDFRTMLAKTNQLPPEFFSRDPETGHTLNAVPGIKIIGGRSWVGVLADSDHKPLLDKSVAPAIQVISQHCQAPVPVEVMSYDQDISQQPIPSEYFVREMVIRRGAERGLPDNELREVIKRRILGALLRQSVAYGLDCPTDDSLGLQVTEVIRPRGLRLAVSSGETDQYVGLVDVKFLVFAKLRGFWFAGNLTSRGYGRIVLNDFRKGEGAA